MMKLKIFAAIIFALFCNHAVAWTGWSNGTMLSLSKAHSQMQSPLWIKEFPALMSQENTHRIYFQAGVFSDMRYIKENTASTAAISLGYKKSSFGLHYSYSGFSVYNEQQMGFSYGQNFGKRWGLGLSASYITHNKIENEKGDRSLNISISTVCKISSSWKIYSLAEIPVTLYSSQKKTLSERYYFRIGVGYSVLENLSIGVDIAKDLRYPLQGGVGLSYLLAQHFFIYASSEIYPFKNMIGIGYISKRWNIEWYGSYQSPLGFTTSVGVAWKISR
ncbi:MAG: hypothetical protein LBQ31_09400 [Bacteroidales bacterium]|jgi:hypothetical protein|nr:hypothetical protein [Bacteroidales bacterium]